MHSPTKIRIRLADTEANMAALADVLKSVGVECRMQRGNGRSPGLVISMGPDDDSRLLSLWESLTDLRMRYLEERQSAIVEQLTFLDANEGDVIL